MKKERISRCMLDKMRENKITDRDLAMAISVPDFVISLYLKGIIMPNIYDLELIAFKLNVSLNELLGGSEADKGDDDMIYYYALKSRKRIITAIIIYIVLLIAAIIVAIIV